MGTVTNTLTHSSNTTALPFHLATTAKGQRTDITNDRSQEANVANNAIHTASNVLDSGTKLFPRYSKSELIQMQQSDSTIGSFLHFWRVGKKPNEEERKNLPVGTRVLLKQWKRLELKDGVLCRTVIDPQEHAVEQLVLPEILKERVICSLHNDMGHQGLERTILQARSRCYWPGMHADVEK